MNILGTGIGQNNLAISSDGLYPYAGTKGEGVFHMQTAFVAPPNPCALSSPPNGSISQQLGTTFSWSAVTGADNYQLQISTNTKVTSAVFDDSTMTTPSRQVNGLVLNTSYLWRVAAKTLGGLDNWSPTFSFVAMRTTCVERIGGEVPGKFGLSQNYPNPSNLSKALCFQLPVVSFVTLKVFDLFGKQVATLVKGEKQPGYYEIHWDPQPPSGVYYFRLHARPIAGGQAGDYRETRKLIIL